MSRVYELYRRLESIQPFGDLERGFRAEVHDPVWFLGRQWQMGEHHGEDASSPVEVRYALDQIPLLPFDGNPELDPQVVPPEAIVESEPDDWWTPGRRVRLGKTYADAAGLPSVDQADPSLLLASMPFPYDRFDGKGYDGFRLYQTQPQNAIFDTVFAEVSPEMPRDLWDPAELAYQATFQAGPLELPLPRHDGGHIDWYSVDAASGPVVPGTGQADHQVIPSRMHYPGAPHPRWWQIENARVDIGGFPPDRAHFATMLLIDLIASHSDDWFTFPVTTANGNLVQLREVVIKDSFDDTWIVTPPTGWSLFALSGAQDAGLDSATLLLWPTVTSPLVGTVHEEVVLGVDEDANMLWAVEMRLNGKDLPTAESSLTGPDDGQTPGGTGVDGSARLAYRYNPAYGLRPYWHPYTIDNVNGNRRFVQGRLADLRTSPAELMPEAQAVLLRDGANYTADPAQQTAPVHQIEPATVPDQGLRLQRRWMLVRQTDGRPRLWMQRQRLPLLSPPVSGLRFDVLEQEETPA
ncbi:MAG: hypothetical protein KDI55_01440 [Anaerolineae bacterium]|nr:hypothetical protein [Anaerolineae bacterium]